MGAATRRLARPWQRALLLALIAGLLATRLVSVFSVAANWDELALLARADRSAETGTFHSGGRPGLAVLLLLPFVADCRDEIQVLRHARLLWLTLTLLYLGGVAALVAQMQPERSRRAGDALLAVGLLALVPAFLEWSIQVRSDQLALAFGTWGGAALLASQRRPALAAAAGVLLGLGFLASQKAVYVGGLAAVLALGALAGSDRLRPGREAARAGLCTAAGMAVLLAFPLLLGAHFQVPERHVSENPLAAATLSRSLSIFEFYRQTIGFDQYRQMLPTLVPHAVLLLGLAAASAAATRRRDGDGPRLALAWALLACGAGVAAFHAAAFAYFWMTLGLFPAVALALARRPLEGLLPTPRVRAWGAAGLALALGLPGLAQAGLMLVDTQAVQRESLGFVHRNLERTDAGFHPESGLFCQLGGPPIQTHFSQTIYRRFGGPYREANTAKMIDTFRDEPVKFIVHSFRLNQFPVELRRFWAENYQPYRGSVFLAGRALSGSPDAGQHFELIVSGHYRWLPLDAPQGLEIDGVPVGAGQVLELTAGPHEARFPEREAAGILVLAVDDPPGPAPLSFYKAY